ncbi:MAG: leucyl/phenylalanyl-tRNA--protein transferase, partial [Acidimicrobiales bacterium]
MPIEPPSSSWGFPDPGSADEHGVVGVGADLEPGTLLAAYRAGLFPMPLHRGGPMAWWSPDPRGVLPLDRLRVSRSLRRSCRRYEIRIDTAFADVVDACASPRRPGGWISPAIRAAYGELHRLGWAHSVEAWDDEGLAGGLYGVAMGGLFAGESMFHRRRDASKVALVSLVELLR